MQEDGCFLQLLLAWNSVWFRQPSSIFISFPVATVAKVIDRFEDETADDILPVGNIRKKASASLLEADKRYSGKATSRKALQEELWGDALSEEGSGKKSYFFMLLITLFIISACQTELGPSQLR